MAPKPKKVLLVDDDPTSTMIASAVLSRLGLDVSSVKGGAEALLALTWSKFDLIVTDLVMPKVDGFEVIRKARETQGHARIIAISGGLAEKLSADHVLDVASKIGADETMTKPVRPEELERMVVTLLAFPGAI